MNMMTKELVHSIAERELPLEGSSPSAACDVRIRAFEPFVGLAIHAGHALPAEAAANVKASDAVRLYEEDPFTDDFIADFPIQLVARDSRFAYDLNRTEDKAIACTPAEAWGIDLWQVPPSAAQVAVCLARHREVFGLLDALAEALVARFGFAVFFDIHSYNFRRSPMPGGRTEFPVFNLGTERLDHAKWRPVLDDWMRQLAALAIPGTPTTAAENDVFFGRGAVCGYLTARHPQVLVLPTEVRKSFMDEHTGAAYPEAIDALRRQLLPAARATVAVAARHLGRGEGGR